MLSKRKPKNLAKNLFATLQVEINSPVNKLEYTNNKRHSKPSLPNVLWALQAPATNGLLRVLSLLAFLISQYCPIASAKPHRLILANLQNFPSFKTLSTFWIGVDCICVQISSQCMTMGEGRRRGYNNFSLKDK